MTLTFLNSKETKEILRKLNKQFGIITLNGIIVKRGKERLFLYQGSMEENLIKKMEYLYFNIERIGTYFAKLLQEKDKEVIRLSIEGTHLFKNQIKENIFEIPDEKALQSWMEGSELNIASGLKGYVVMKYKNNLLGCGKASTEKITNFIPKSRRLKIKNLVKT